MADLLSRLNTEPEKNQLQIIAELSQTDDTGIDVLIAYLSSRQGNPPNVVDGKAYQTLLKSGLPKAKDFLSSTFQTGLVPLQTERSIDYSPLQTLLAQQEYEAADRVTLEKLCELAGQTAVQRKWLYFTEIEKFPITDLRTINSLWLIFSEGKFGFSVQRELWLSVGKNWDQLWPRIGWRTGNNWTRYPQGFTWDLSAPRGHLPLSNQLRGIRVFDALLRHPAWT